MYSSPMSATFGSAAEVHEEAAHEGRSGLVGHVSQGIDIGHELVAQTQILREDGLGLFAV